MISLRFYSLTGPFALIKTEDFESFELALVAVRAYAEPAGYTSIKKVDDGDFEGFRYTGRTPGGRGGRNIAIGDYAIDDSDPWSGE